MWKFLKLFLLLLLFLLVLQKCCMAENDRDAVLGLKEPIVSGKNLSGKLQIIKRLEIFSHVANDTTSGQPKDGGDNPEKPAKMTLPLLIIATVIVLVVLLFLSIYYYKKTRNLEADLMMIKKKQQQKKKNNNNNFTQNSNLNHSQNGVDQSGERKIAVREPIISTTETTMSTESTERSNGGEAAAAGERGKLTFLDSDLRIELDDLLKASAEGLGKGNFGNCYKAMLEEGPTVVVKRLRDLRALSREEFVAHVKSIAQNKHPNLLPLLGYYYAKDEKLLLYKFAPNGNLYTRIHRARGTRERNPFRWNARLSVARAVARAVEYLHLHSTPLTVGGGGIPPHGNLKSTNVLLDESDIVLLTDYGLASLIAPPITAQRMVSYRSPEFQTYKKVCAKSDVWSYGCLLLELLTGKVSSQSAPAGVNGADLCSWVHRAVREEWTAEIFDAEIAVQRSASEGMLRLLQIAIKCCDKSPEKRPEMSDVVREVEMIRVSETEDEEDLSLTDNSQTPSR
ncbi:PREDICTED: probable inactive receptor kinase At2g26730 [Ipomoea nil]|uniref:probable inactive receptor kinase At2g26730 n=1 Tax=Ipomoea nil TaxID=35883 RepID=UPI000901A9D9|nr:PREDICTED: probable inactive receptor kinase At2g26730 [Ipomoea nil]